MVRNNIQSYYLSRENWIWIIIIHDYFVMICYSKTLFGNLGKIRFFAR